MHLDESFWMEHAHLGGRQLLDKYPDRYSDDANWRKAKRKAAKKWPHVFTDKPYLPPAIAENKHHRSYHKPARELTLAFCGDTHGGSAEERSEELNTFYDLCVTAGVTDVLHTGDITAGDRVYPGQVYELRDVGCDKQADGVVARYPQRDGITTHFITGNHDYSHWKLSGVDIGRIFAHQRPDMHYLGRYGATVELSPGFTVYVLHQDGGVPYALSYKRQKIVEGFIGGSKPRIFISGHDHQAVFFRYRNVCVYGTGCFEGQSDFLRRKGIDPQICGWIANVKLDGDGGIVRITNELVTFYDK
jgi:hypothetical protein